MDRDTFLSRIREEAGLESIDDSERMARATLQTLGERIVRGEASDLAAQLPPELGDALRTDQEAERFDWETFLSRVASRSGVDESTALRGAQSVMAVTREAVTDGEFGDVVSQLPNDFQPLLVGAGGMPGRHT